MISWSDFEKIEMRVGTILQAETFAEARKPAYKLQIDFGEPKGVLCSSAQVTVHYSVEDLKGKQVIAVVNFPPKRIAGFESECLVLGLYDENNDVVLLQPERNIPNGCRVG
jgi:tRNA-binding protein